MQYAMGVEFESKMASNFKTVYNNYFPNESNIDLNIMEQVSLSDIMHRIQKLWDNLYFLADILDDVWRNILQVRSWNDKSACAK